MLAKNYMYNEEPDWNDTSALLFEVLRGGEESSTFPGFPLTSAKTKGASNWKQTWPCLMA